MNHELELLTGLSNPDDMHELSTGMSNFDHGIDDSFEAELRTREARVFGRHAALEFNGLVWFEKGQFHELVFRYGTAEELISASTLEELMDEVNEKWGDE